MIGNNAGFARVFENRIVSRFDLMYSMRSYVHWFVGEGMEEGEFAEAREEVGMMVKDYLEVASDQLSEEVGYDMDMD